MTADIYFKYLKNIYPYETYFSLNCFAYLLAFKSQHTLRAELHKLVL